MALSSEQQRVARKIVDEGRRLRAPKHVIRAALATSLVEANLKNVRYGDRDSLGAFQQRPSQGWGSPEQVTNVRYAAQQFYKRAIPAYNQGLKGGALAQSVQRSAFPERYAQQWGTAGSILRGLGGAPAPQQPQQQTQPQVQTETRVIPAPMALPNPLQTDVPSAAPVMPEQRPGEIQRRRKQRTVVEPTQEGRIELKQKVIPGQQLSAQQQQQPVAQGPAPQGSFQAVKRAAKALEKKQLPYTWGGGHSTSGRPAPGLDCSGAVRWVLNKAGIRTPSMVSGDFMNYGKPGAGAVTIFASPTHVFMKIGNKFFGTSRTNPAGGPGFIEGGTSTGGYAVRHIPVSRAQARALGASAKKEGGGATRVQVRSGNLVDKPQFSDRPILSDQARPQQVEKVKIEAPRAKKLRKPRKQIVMGP